MNDNFNFPETIGLVVFDFDGVFTDNKVYFSSDGTETVSCSRADSLGINLLQEAGFAALVLSTEKNDVVRKRCKKMNINCISGVKDKLTILKTVASEKNINLKDIIYLGNDVNDLECLQAVGCSVVVADAYPEVIKEADLLLSCKGGNGAVRELCDLIISQKADS